MHKTFVGLLLAWAATGNAATPASAPAETGLEAGGIWDILDEQREASKSIVSATKSAQLLDDAPAVISVITSYDIEARGYRSVAEAVQSLAGIYVANDGVEPNLAVRGISGGLRGYSDVIKVMIDGQPTDFRPYTSNDLGPSQIPLPAIDRIEVIRGPASAVYGANAFLGVINIITKQATAGPSFAYSLAGYLTNNKNPGGGGWLTGSDTVGRLKMTASVSGDFINASGLTLPNTPPLTILALKGPYPASKNDFQTPESFHGRLDFDGGVAGTFRLDGNLQHLGAYGEFTDWSLLTHLNRISVLNGFARLRWEKEIIPKLTLSAFFAVQEGAPAPDEKLFTNNTIHYFHRDLKSSEWSAGTEAVYRFRQQDQVRVGFDISSDTEDRLFYPPFITAGNVPVVIPHENLPVVFTNVGGEAQLLSYPFSWLGAIAGLRFDYNNSYGSGLSPQAGVVIKPKSFLTFKLLYGRSFKAPSGVQLYAQPGLDTKLGTADILGAGAGGLKSQLGDTFEAVAVVEPLSWLKLSVNGFYMAVQNQITFKVVGLNLEAQNTESVTSFGVEAEARVTSRRVDVFLNGTYQNAQSIVALQAANPTGQSNRFETTPQWLGNLGVQTRWPEIYLQGYAELRFVGDREASAANELSIGRAYELPAYAILDLAISTIELKLGPTTAHVMVRVTNLLDTKYATAGFANYDIPNLGRSFSLVWSQRF